MESPLFLSFSATDLDASQFAPAAALALKAKQFDDGLYACVEMASDTGIGGFPAKKDFLLRLLQALASDSDRTAAAILTAAARLEGQQPQVSAEVADEAESLRKGFWQMNFAQNLLGSTPGARSWRPSFSGTACSKQKSRCKLLVRWR